MLKVFLFIIYQIFKTIHLKIFYDINKTKKIKNL